MIQFMQAAGGSNASFLIMMVIIFAIMWLFMIRPQQKRQKEITKFRQGVVVGDKVVTAGGIYGKVRGIKETTFAIEVAPNVVITIDKNSVYPTAQDAQQEIEAEKK